MSILSVLAPLLGQQTAAVDPNQILVQGSVPRQPIPDAQINPDNSGQIAANPPPGVRPHLSNQQLADLQGYDNLPEHKGAFGQKGTLRNILGTIGDAFLVQSGHNPIYAPRREQEKISDAMTGFVQHPLEAIQRVAQENPQLAQAMYQNYQNRGYQDQEIAARKAQIEATSGLRNATLFQKFGTNVGGLLGAADSKEAWDKAYQIAQTQANKLGYDLQSDYGISPEYSPENQALASHIGLTSSQNITTNQGQQRINETGRHNRVDEQIGSQKVAKMGHSSNPTNASLAAPILAKVQSGQQITPQENEYLQRLGYGTQSKGKPSILDQILHPGGQPQPQTQAPPKGYKNKYGMIYSGTGDPNDIKNWHR